MREIEDLSDLFASRIADGFEYGDFQFATDPATDDFLRRGVFSCYRPIEHDGPLPEGQRALTRDDWRGLLVLAHTDKSRAFELYAEHYLATSGQLYHCDAHQMGDYEDGYHRALDAHLGAPHRATEMISELYVPRDRLADFMADVADDFRRNEVDAIYGTIRLIERDDDSFLAVGARAVGLRHLQPAHGAHGRRPRALGRELPAPDRPGGRRAAARTSSRTTAGRRGSRSNGAIRPSARSSQAKLRHDPEERFQSDWYRHHKQLLA